MAVRSIPRGPVVCECLGERTSSAKSPMSMAGAAADVCCAGVNSKAVIGRQVPLLRAR